MGYWALLLSYLHSLKHTIKVVLYTSSIKEYKLYLAPKLLVLSVLWLVLKGSTFDKILIKCSKSPCGFHFHLCYTVLDIQSYTSLSLAWVWE